MKKIILTLGLALSAAAIQADPGRNDKPAMKSVKEVWATDRALSPELEAGVRAIGGRPAAPTEAAVADPHRKDGAASSEAAKKKPPMKSVEEVWGPLIRDGKNSGDGLPRLKW